MAKWYVILMVNLIHIRVYLTNCMSILSLVNQLTLATPRKESGSRD